MEIALALILARILGYLFNRYRQPIVIGEILAGIILGSSVLGRLGGIDIWKFEIPTLNFISNEFEIFAEMGILFLLFISGLETKISTIRKVGKTTSLAAIGGITLPFILGSLVGISFGFSLKESLVIGTILIATSVGVTARTLMDLHLLDTDVGATILGSAVIDDVIGIILLALVLGTGCIWIIGIKVIIFFLFVLYIGLKIIDKIMVIGEKVHLPKVLISISLALCMIFAFLAEEMEIAAITGAFIAGLIIGTTVQSRRIVEEARTIGYGFFIPLFFVWIGASIDLSDFTVIGFLAIAIIIMAIIGKIVGCGIGARIGGLSFKKSLQVGVGMIPRMEVALIVVTAAISTGILKDDIAHQFLAITILLAIVTTIITPILIKTTFKY